MSNKDIIGWIFIILLAYCFGWFDIFINNKTSYQIFCTPGKTAILRIEDYKIFPDHQMVIVNSEIGPEKMKECIVYDKDNWKCKLGDDEIQMIDGSFISDFGKDNQGYSWQRINHIRYFLSKHFYSQNDLNTNCPVFK